MYQQYLYTLYHENCKDTKATNFLIVFNDTCISIFPSAKYKLLMVFPWSNYLIFYSNCPPISFFLLHVFNHGRTRRAMLWNVIEFWGFGKSLGLQWSLLTPDIHRLRSPLVVFHSTDSVLVLPAFCADIC